MDSKVLYTAKTHTIGSKESTGRSSDGHLDVKLSLPLSDRKGTNPEQLIGVGWSACFYSALKDQARKQNIQLPDETTFDAEVSLNHKEDSYFFSAKLNVSIPGLDIETAKMLVELADQNCPFSKAIRGNISAIVNLV